MQQARSAEKSASRFFYERLYGSIEKVAAEGVQPEGLKGPQGRECEKGRFS